MVIQYGGSMVNWRFFTVLTIILLMSLTVGCFSKQVRISTIPEHARISIDGIKKGKAPIETILDFPQGHSVVNVEAETEGYENGFLEIRYDPPGKRDYLVELKKQEYVELELVSFESRLGSEGVRLETIRRRTVAYLEVIERSPNAKSVTRVTQFIDPSVRIGAPIASPVEDALLYEVFITETNNNTFSNIIKITVGSVSKTTVTVGKWKNFNPSFSPDGEYIYFASNRAGGAVRLWRINSSGSGGITKMTSSNSEDFYPSLAAGADRIVYCSNIPNADREQIWTIGLRGNLPAQLREGKEPQVSPRGHKILFVRRNASIDINLDTDRNPDTPGVPQLGTDQIWVMNVDGSGETQLTSNTDHHEMQPRWSPDGKWIVFTSNEGLDSRKRHNYDIWVMRADGTDKTQLTTNGSRDDFPYWDHTGKYIYFRSNRGGYWDIWRMEPNLPGVGSREESSLTLG